jgi:Ribbon-helix-helix domain
MRKNGLELMAGSGKTRITNQEEAFDFSLATKRRHDTRRRQQVLADSETLRSHFQRVQNRIDWDQLRRALTEDEVNAALSGVDQFTRERLPSPAVILATVQDSKCPKLRPIRFLAESCALAMQTNPKSANLYSPRYSRDICYEERKRRAVPKSMTDLEYWCAQDQLGHRVPVTFLHRINRENAKEKQQSANREIRTELTYTDIRESMDPVKKKRTTVWLPEITVARLKKLSAETGAPMAELFRRAVEAYLVVPKSKRA